MVKRYKILITNYVNQNGDTFSVYRKLMTLNIICIGTYETLKVIKYGRKVYDK